MWPEKMYPNPSIFQRVFIEVKEKVNLSFAIKFVIGAEG